MNTSVNKKEYTYGVTNVMKYIMSVLGLLNIIALFYPMVNISYIYKYIDFGVSHNPSLFNIFFNGVVSDGKYRILFIVISIALFAAVVLSIIFFIKTVLKKDPGCILSVIASAIFFIFSFSAYLICILSFLNSGITVEIISLTAFKFSTIILESIMMMSVANIVISLLIMQERKNILLYKQ